MMLHKNTPCVDNNHWLLLLNTQLKSQSNKNKKMSPKIVKPTNKKTLS